MTTRTVYQQKTWQKANYCFFCVFLERSIKMRSTRSPLTVKRDVTADGGHQSEFWIFQEAHKVDDATRSRQDAIKASLRFHLFM